MSSSTTLRRVFATLALSFVSLAPLNATDAFHGAIYTSGRTGTAVNANEYGDTRDVFLNGGPQNAAAQGLPDGRYYFQVTDPSGATLLSQDAAAARQLLVVDGRVSGAAEVEGAHADGDFNPANGATGVQLWPFDVTPNEGGEYKAWLIRQTPDTTIDPLNPRVLRFVQADAKTDNFKVVVPELPLTITAPEAVVVCNDSKKDGAIVPFPSVVTNGGRAPVALSFSHASGSFFQLGTTEVLATATDAAGKTVSATFAVTVKDCEGPRFASGATPVFTAQLPADSCSATVNYDETLFTDPSGLQSVTFSPASGSAFQTGVTTVSYTAADGAGNISEGTFLVTVSDTTAPTIASLPDLVVSTAPGKCSAVVSFAPNATDCSPVTVSTSHASGSEFAKGVTVVNVTAVDAYGNTANASFSITVKDTESPALALPASLNLSTDPGKCSAVVNYSIRATDNCGAVELTIDGPAAGTAFPKGTTVVTATAVDSSGNVSTASFSVTISDSEAPAIAAPADVVSALYTVHGSNVAAGTPVASDNCGLAGVVGLRSDGAELNAPYPLGTTTITWTATDTSGNTSIATQTITIVGGSVSTSRFYDGNGNSLRELAENLLSGWRVTLTGNDSSGNPVGPVVGETTTDGSASFANVPVGTYRVTVAKPVSGNWVETLPAAQQVSVEAETPQVAVTFAGFALGSANAAGGGGLTLGFWSNKNGEKTVSTALTANLAALSGLNLRTATGTEFNPTSYASYRTWLLGGSATNMAYMLSVQLSAMYNNVNVRPNTFGGVEGTALVYVPAAKGANGNGVLSVNELIAEANAALAANGLTTAAGADRSHQEALKTGLDNGNNNRNFVQPAPVPFSF